MNARFSHRTVIRSWFMMCALLLSPFASNPAVALTCLDFTPAIATSPYMPVNHLSTTYVYLGPPAGGSCGMQIMHGNYITSPFAQIRRINNNCTEVRVAQQFCQGYYCPYTSYVGTLDRDVWAQNLYLPGYSILGSWYKAILNPFPDINTVSCFARKAI